MGRPASPMISRWLRPMPTRAACGSWTDPTKSTKIRSAAWSCASTRRVSQPPTDSADEAIRAMHSLEHSYLLGIEGVTELWLVRHADVYDALAAHPAARIVMIGHGIAILNYLADVLRLVPGTLRLYPPFTGVSIVRAQGDRRAVGTLFDVSHLEAQ